MIQRKQLSLADVFADCREKLENDKYKFLKLLENVINLDEIVPPSFIHHFRARTRRPRKYQLFAMLWALILQRIFSIPTDSLSIVFLKYSKELRDFCGFDKVPDASKFTRFKQDFLSDLQLMFDNLVDLTEPICQQINAELADIIAFDTTGVEAFVTENNPKFSNKMLIQSKSLAKIDPTFDASGGAYALYPKAATSNPEIKLQYINGHFCYAYKFGIITNGLGIVRHISFYNKDYLSNHPEIVVGKQSNSPDKDKTLGDSKALIPTLTDFFAKHPLFNPKIFLGDAAFDAIENYRALFNDFGFEKTLIPLKTKLVMPDSDCPLNEHGVPCCPRDKSLPMKREGSKSHLRCGLPTMKFVCPKMKYVMVEGKYKRRTSCENPCTDSLCGRMFYIYPEKNFRAYPGILRGSDEWESLYKLRVVVEKSINHFKHSFCVGKRKTQNEKTTHADLLLAGITQLLSVVVADKIHKHQFIRSLKPLVA